MEAYTQHPGKVIDPGDAFKHVMALALNPARQNEGVIRCIVSRTGDVQVKGYVDRSVLYKVAGEGERFTITEPLRITGENELVEKMGGGVWDYIGLEDPDIWIDETGRTHLYFTIAFISKDPPRIHNLISLGHAEGDSLGSLVMTEPVVAASKTEYRKNAKEVSIAPPNSTGIHVNLVESGDRRKDEFYDTSRYAEHTSFSVVRVARAQDMGKPWDLGEIVFHPADHKISWIAEHASPGPLLPRSFLDIGENKLVGIMNGREASTQAGAEDSIHYKTFSAGLFIYDYERGKIEWVSPEPFIRDSEAKTITFASCFVETAPGEGTLYAHVDDSFVRAYTLYAEGVKALLP